MNPLLADSSVQPTHHKPRCTGVQLQTITHACRKKWWLCMRYYEIDFHDSTLADAVGHFGLSDLLFLEQAVVNRKSLSPDSSRVASSSSNHRHRPHLSLHPHHHQTNERVLPFFDFNGLKLIRRRRNGRQRVKRF